MMAACYAVFTVITFFLNLFVPESPYWTLNFQSEKYEKIVRSVRWIYRNEQVQFILSLSIYTIYF